MPMFLVHRKGLVADGTNPVLMYGYGGFNVSTTPNFNALRLALLERGFIYASVNMRGGGEYGEAWHDAGTKTRKQNVFDDFIAAAEWMIAAELLDARADRDDRRIERRAARRGGDEPAARALQRGGSAGGRDGHAAVPQVHNRLELDRPTTVRATTRTNSRHSTRTRRCTTSAAAPPIPRPLIVTADHDDRVVPAHSFKYAATLQAPAGAERPALIRIETKSGHGASSTTKLIELTADIYAFILQELGIRNWTGLRSSPAQGP